MITFLAAATPSTSVQAGLLARSLRRHYPDARLLAASPRAVSPDQVAPFELVEELGIDSPPALLAYALRDAETAIYIDPTVDVYAPFTPVLDLLQDAAIVQTRRMSDLPRTGSGQTRAI